MKGYTKLNNGKFRVIAELKRECEWCNKVTDIDELNTYQGNLLCDRCSESFFYCEFCNEYQSIDDIRWINEDFDCCENCLPQAQYDIFEQLTNDSNRTIESETANKLESEKRLTRIETFITGFMDGRGGYINGKYTRELDCRDSKNAIECLIQNMGYKFIWIVEYRGQFQAYITIGVAGKTTKKQWATLANLIASLEV